LVNDPATKEELGQHFIASDLTAFMSFHLFQVYSLSCALGCILDNF